MKMVIFQSYIDLPEGSRGIQRVYCLVYVKLLSPKRLLYLIDNMTINIEKTVGFYWLTHWQLSRAMDNGPLRSL